ncbi:MAG: hypothetical protein JWO13_1789 [Acidobacteriales bacterium]|nr:hypothetical protein [Terriglobales bacterium]
MRAKGMRYKTRFALLLTLTLLSAGYAQTPDKAKLDQFFDRLAEKNKAMGSLAIAKDGNVLYTRSVGFSQINGTEKKPLTATTRYRIGSIAKMFTAAMIFQLVEEGKLRLTDTLDKFYPQIPNAGKITIAHILAHRSGIHDLTDDRSYSSWKMNPKTHSEMVAIIAKSTPDFEPDAKYSYSNSGYLLLSYIVENVTGKTYQEALQKRITSKIGLKDTYLGTGYTDVSKNESFSFRWIGEWKQEVETNLSIPGGAGAIISTPNDMAKFIQALFELKLVSQKSLDQMMKNKMAMETYPLDGKTFYGHGGGIDGFGAWLAYLPEEKLAIAYTSNGKVYPVANIVGGVYDIYRNKPFTMPSFEAVNVSPEVLDKYVGVYSNPEVPVKFTITRDGATPYAQPTGQSSYPLEATAQDKFKIEPPGIVMEFDALKNQMLLKRRGVDKVFTKEK